MQMPFFLVAHGWSKLAGAEPNGYSKPYVVMIGFAAIAYALIGLWALAKLLGAYHVGMINSCWILIFVAFGTHLFYYTVVAPGMSHVYSFALITTFFWLACTRLGKAKPLDLLFMGGLLGLTILVRPINGMVVLAVPFLLGEWSQLREAVANLILHSRALVTAAVVTIGVIALQPLAYYLGCGSWWLDTYPGEEFHWTDPHFLDILFSYRKGLFLYTPICFVALFGLWHWVRRSQFAALAWSGFFLVITYVFSCWWNWWYGGSFSSRPYVEFLPLFGIPLGMMLKELRKPWRTGLITLLCMLTVFCQVQTYQARYFRIHYKEMDRQRYWDEFLRLDKITEWPGSVRKEASPPSVCGSGDSHYICAPIQKKVAC
jgi:hypothetical protein